MRLRALIALCALFVGMAVFIPTSDALAYPPTVCSTISISTTTPLPGESITIHGVNFQPNATVRLEMRSTTFLLKTVKTDAHGEFTTTVKMPAGVTGHHDIVAVGGTIGSSSCPVDPVQILDLGGATSGSTGSGGGTAFTGLDVAALLAIAAALLGIGVMFTHGGRRRNRHRHAGRH